MLLEEFLRSAGLTQVDAARKMKIPLNRLNEIIRGRRGITADTALRLARLFETSPEFWMGLQTDWDLWHAARAQRKAGRSQGSVVRARSRARRSVLDRALAASWGREYPHNP
jgi:antitoxin HigA-1